MKKSIRKKCLIIPLIFTFIFTITINPALAFAEEQTSSPEISSVKGWDVNLQTNEDKLWINNANFPDPIFRQYILDNFDKDKNGYIGYPEILEYQKICISNEPELASLQGIEYFQNLRSLNCSYTSVASIPTEMFEFLESLDCSNTAVASIDVSCCPRLTSLSVTSTNISSLDVSRLKSLQWFECSATKVSSLDISENSKLLSLFCAKTDISCLDLSNQPSLIRLDLSETKISSLDLSHNTKLQTLDCSRCQLRELDLAKHTALTFLSCAQMPILCINLPDDFSGIFVTSCDHIETLYLTSPDTDTIDLRQYAPSIQASKITNVSGASINGTILTDLTPGRRVSYTYQCGGGKTLDYEFIPNYKTDPAYTILPDSCVLTGTAAAAEISAQSSMAIQLDLVLSEATRGILPLRTSSGEAVTTTVTLPASILSLLSKQLTGGVQVQTDGGTYLLSSEQLAAIAKASASSATVDVTFSKSDKGTDLIYIKAIGKEGYLVGTSITLSPDGTSGAASPSSSAALRSGVEKTTIKVSSSVGKRYIRLSWKKSAGYKMDYYEVFRSTKKSSGYGREPFYRTSSGAKTTYKNTKALKKGTRYYFKVRGVRLIDGVKVYTRWSNKTWRIAK